MTRKQEDDEFKAKQKYVRLFGSFVTLSIQRLESQAVLHNYEGDVITRLNNAFQNEWMKDEMTDDEFEKMLKSAEGEITGTPVI
ncbi:hypothetical protein HN954_01165 [bacterium]|jgi:hypothetical protein|nr:hypothetical protein [bacterium]MBT6832437.1 hypothetical protein [bacterium]MBT6996021.1 hypothetical protein [bacterium]MBT7772583.1 hypothetical protein [bacterium]